jgi:hypothetical protein
MGKAKDFVTNVWSKVKNIPVIGNLADRLANTPIPMFGGKTAKEIAGTAGTVIDTGRSVNDIIQSV